MVCPGCGAARGGLVPLDQGTGESSSLPRWEGPPGQVEAALAGRSSEPGVTPDARARLGFARRLLELLPAGTEASVWLDLRPASAGPEAAPAQRDGTRLVRLPWLVLRTGAHEARVVRVASVRRGMVFRGGQVGPGAGPALDELTLTGPGGSARRTLRAGAPLTALPPLDPVTPPPGPLPASAPGESGESGVAALVQVAAGMLLLLGLGLGLERAVAAAPPPPPPEQLVVGALGDLDPVVRRAAVLDAGRLPPLTRARLLRSAAERDDDPQVRSLALEVLAGEGELGATCLALVHRNGGPPLGTRLQALRLLRGMDDPRAGRLASAGLRQGGAHPRLRVAWADTLAEGAAPAELHGLLEDPEPLVRAAGGRALLVRLGAVAVPNVREALTRGGRPPVGSDAERAQVELARALRPFLRPEERRELAGLAALGSNARAALAP